MEGRGWILKAFEGIGESRGSEESRKGVIRAFEATEASIGKIGRIVEGLRSY